MQTIIKTIKDIVSFETTYDKPNEIRKCISYIKSIFQEEGLKTKVYTKNNVLSLQASNKIKKNYKLIFSGHIDVVPGNPNQFKPLKRNGRIYGRGTADMKGAVAAMIHSYIEMVRINPQIDAAILITSDEEIGGFNGTNYLVNKVGLRSDCVFLPDTIANYKLLVEAKAVIQIKVCALGKAVHGSVPWKGKNAIEKLTVFYTEVNKKLNKATFASPWNTSVNLGKLNGGTSTNSVPDYAEMFLDIRYPVNQKAKVLSSIKSVAKNKDVKTEIVLSADATANDIKNKYFKLAEELIVKHKKIKPEYIKENGSSDGRYFSAHGIPVIMFNPKTSKSHGKNEWIDVKDLSDYQSILKELISNICLEK